MAKRFVRDRFCALRYPLVQTPRCPKKAARARYWAGDVAGERGRGAADLREESPRPQRSGDSIRVAHLGGSSPAAAGRTFVR
jgi:hypothetical protein